MSRRFFLASFADEEDLLGAVRLVRDRQWDVVDVYSPYPIHGLEEILGWRRSWLPAACFLGGATGVVVASWFQFWTTAVDWPVNVGGRPWNSLPAFVPVIFEMMVLLAGFTLVFSYLLRCRLYPGKAIQLAAAGVTNDRFAVALCDPMQTAGLKDVQQLLQGCHAINLDERDEEHEP